MKNSYILFIVSFILAGCTSAPTVLYSDDFTSGPDQWVIEAESEQHQILLKDSILDVVAPGGITFWFHHKLEGNIQISFDSRVVDGGGPWDRVSDMNCFWMANDPEHPDDFFARSEWRNGTFGKYYSLSLYYAGYGGNTNTTTRFRKYNGDYAAFAERRERPEILKEYTDPAHLITPNEWYHTEITILGNHIRYSVNNEILFDYTDENPYTSGYFGFRTVKNHIQYRDFKVFQLQAEQSQDN